MKFFNDEPKFELVGRIGQFARFSGSAVTISILLLVGSLLALSYSRLHKNTSPEQHSADTL